VRERALIDALRCALLEIPKELFRIVSGYCVVTSLLDTERMASWVLDTTADQWVSFSVIDPDDESRQGWRVVFARDPISQRRNFVATVRWPHHCMPAHRCYVGVTFKARALNDATEDIIWAVSSGDACVNRKYCASWSNGMSYIPVEEGIPWRGMPCSCKPGLLLPPLPGTGIPYEREWTVRVEADLTTSSLRFFINDRDQGILWTDIPLLGDMHPFVSFVSSSGAIVRIDPTPGHAE